MADEAAADSVTPYKEILAMANKNGGSLGVLGSMFIVDTAPERRQVVRITGEPGNYKSEVVKDYQSIVSFADEERKYSDKVALIKEEGDVELAALDVAWRALADHFAGAEDQAAVLKVMRGVTHLMGDQAATGNTFTCQYCQRDFASEDAAIKHLSNVHAAREKETKMKTERD